MTQYLHKIVLDIRYGYSFKCIKCNFGCTIPEHIIRGSHDSRYGWQAYYFNTMFRSCIISDEDYKFRELLK